MGCTSSCPCLARGVQSLSQSFSGKPSKPASEEKPHPPLLATCEPPDGVLDLPDFLSHEQTHEPQSWYHCELEGITAARLKFSWKDQGWGNRKGAIHARVTMHGECFGVSAYAWRRIGPHPAPHDRAHVEIPLPEEFFSSTDLPRGAQLELGCEVGGGGGHSLHVDSAKIEIERRSKVLFANFAMGEAALHLSDLGGTVVAVINDVTIEDARDVIINSIRKTIARQLPGEHFKVMMVADTEFSFVV